MPNITFQTATAPTTTRVTEENPFLSAVAKMPLTGEGKDHTGRDMVPAGTEGGALAFTLEGSAQARGDNANPELAKAIRQLNTAADTRPGGPVTARKAFRTIDATYEETPGVPAKGNKPAVPASRTLVSPAKVEVTFYLVPKVRRSAAAVASTPNTVPAAS